MWFMTRSPSLNLRLVLTASVVLIAFLGLAGFALERAFARSSLALIEERLLAQVYGLLSAANVSPPANLELTGDLPDPRFSVPESGLYGEVVRIQPGASVPARVWVSPNTLGRVLAFPSADEPGVAVFAETRARNGERMLGMAFPIEWELETGKVLAYVFRVAVPHAAYDDRLQRFRRSLWGWLAAATVGLLVAQALLLSWCLSPLRRIAREVAEIERGQRAELSPAWPRELRPLAVNLNHLIAVSRRQIERYRNALGDLAHSLKTPLAVLRNTAESPRTTPDDIQRAIAEQVGRMDRTVSYQLQRAAAAGRTALGQRILFVTVAEKIVSSLAKVYAQEALTIEHEQEDGLSFKGDEGDLTEVIGNLMDNACKWANSIVRLSAAGQCTERLTEALQITIEDDGPGIEEDQIMILLSRGARIDEATPGHGLGLAIVREIVEEAYDGSLAIDRSPLGGARVTVVLKAPGPTDLP